MQQFKRVHDIMCKLMVNEMNLLDDRSSKLILLTSTQIESPSDRTFIIGGLYVITIGSVGPVSVSNTTR